ncbi:polysaccharide deacetylase family protein [Lentilactobacillus diolivorans]|uniref:Polysaccharide deacetylase n=2 Tax=Lentilactobacillus diolivorans TaxID=179838 RepID=A0A0R1SDK5_9LACO|nr:polysaccharide deacetylase family protein [Lentilactobacillus diolivorans]KRL65396.1 polysaccharide deacetylase [Lentilactobacillus diolivorans DSM 14421]GEP23218.1 intercellular adhesion protein [Lentilactobacillus diolivorans]
MSKTKRKWILTTFILVFLALLAVTVRHNIKYQLGNRPSYAISKYDERIKNGVMVFCYHRVLDDTDNDIVKFDEEVSPNSQFHDFNVNLSSFKHQMAYLQTHHIRVISLPTLIHMVTNRQPIHGRYVVITFDDIDRTVINNAFPVLLKYHYPFTDSIITGNTGWYKAGEKLATWPAIQRMQKKAGRLATFAVHTNRMHYLVDNGTPVFNLPGNLVRFKHDYATSQTVLKRKIGYRSPIFTYPYGSGTPQVQKFLAEQPGLKAILTLNNGIVTNQSDLKVTPRVIINNSSWPSVAKWIRQ